jgi:RHS repeat-associated protein
LGEYGKATSSALPVVRKVYSYGADGLISQREVATAKSYWYAFGPQAETRAIYDVNQALVNSYSYDAYGLSLGKVEGVSNEFEYTGRFGCSTDDLSGLVLCGQRWYSARLGRWLSRDPIHYEGGANLYVYASNSPIQFIDFEGYEPLSTEDATDIINNATAVGGALGAITGGVMGGGGGLLTTGGALSPIGAAGGATIGGGIGAAGGAMAGGAAVGIINYFCSSSDNSDDGDSDYRP